MLLHILVLNCCFSVGSVAELGSAVYCRNWDSSDQHRDKTGFRNTFAVQHCGRSAAASGLRG